MCSLFGVPCVSPAYTYGTAHKGGRNANISHLHSLCSAHDAWFCWHPSGMESCVVPSFSSELFPVERSMDVRYAGDVGLINEKRMDRLNCCIKFCRLLAIALVSHFFTSGFLLTRFKAFTCRLLQRIAVRCQNSFVNGA